MTYLSSGLLIAGALSSGAALAALPFHPQAAQTLLQEAPPAGHSRLRVSVSNGDSPLEAQVRLGSLSVCSTSACYRPATPISVNLVDTSAGTSETVAEFAVPRHFEVRSVHFESVAGPKTLTGDLVLTTPLKVEEGYEGGAEIMVVVSKGKSAAHYHPTMSAINVLRSFGASVYYNPKIAASATLKFGTTLSIPAGATAAPQIFNVAIHDTGDQYPMVDIYPEVKLSRKASVTFTEIKRSKEANQTATTTGARKSKLLDKTGLIRAAVAGEASDAITVGDQPATLSAATDQCVASLSGNQEVITNALAATGTVYLSWCETSAPFVHIAVTNLQDSRQHMRLAYDPPFDSRSTLLLRRIANWAPGNQVVINGFTWEGDSGIFSGGAALALGFVQDEVYVLGNNAAGGGYGGIAGYAGNKLGVLVRPQGVPDWREGTVPPIWTLPIPGAFSLVSSSTSIVKAGNCASDSLVSRWSAMGTSAGRMIFMSSTSGSATSAAELCAVFKALGATYAIRLDGGPSAGMIIDGVHKNPLVGMESVKYGVARHVAYGLKMGYPGAGSTPAPSQGGVVITPRNPCITNPRACARAPT